MAEVVKLITEQSGLEIDLLAPATGTSTGFKLIDQQWTPANAGFEIFTPDERIKETIPVTCDNATFATANTTLQAIIRAARQHGMNPLWTDYAWLYYTTALENPKRALITNAYLQPLMVASKSPLHTDLHIEANLIIERLPWWEAETHRNLGWNDMSIPEDVPQNHAPGRGTIPSRIARLIISAPSTQTDEINHFWIGVKPRDQEEAEGGPGQPSEFISSWSVLDSQYALLGSPYATDPIGGGDIQITWTITHNAGNFGRLFEYWLSDVYSGTRPHHFIGRYLVLAFVAMDRTDRTLVMQLTYGTQGGQADHLYNTPVEIQPINTNAHYYELGYLEIPSYSMRERDVDDVTFTLQLDAYILENTTPDPKVTIRHLVLMPANHISIRNGAVVGGGSPKTMTIRREADDKIAKQGIVDIHSSNKFALTPVGGEIVFVFQRGIGLFNADEINVDMEVHDRYDTWRNTP